MLDLLSRIAIVAALAVAVAVIGQHLDRALHPPPSLAPRGWTCWDMTHLTDTDRRHSYHCEPAPGWHLESSARAGMVVVPDDAEPVRRRDRYVIRD